MKLDASPDTREIHRSRSNTSVANRYSRAGQSLVGADFRLRFISPGPNDSCLHQRPIGLIGAYPMIQRLWVLLITVAFGLSPHVGRAQGAAGANVSAASVLVLGRLPLPAELPPVSASLNDEIGRLRQRVLHEPALRRAMLAQSCRDAFGREASDAELADPAASPSYTEEMSRHLQVLASHADEFEQVIRRAYQVVIHREPYAEEVAYWKKGGPLTFVLLVGGVDGWARRNQPGLMVTGGVPTLSINCVYLTTVRLSAAEAAQALSAFDRGNGGAATGSAQHVIAAGGERLATSGGMYFVAAGSPGLLE